MYDTKREYQTDEALLEAECDNMAVDEFAKAMKEKLALARAKGRSGWNDKEACSDEYLSYLFYHCLPKLNEGNFVDLANFLMFLHVRGANPNVLSDAIVSLLTSTIKESERRGEEIKRLKEQLSLYNSKPLQCQEKEQ